MRASLGLDRMEAEASVQSFIEEKLWPRLGHLAGAAGGAARQAFVVAMWRMECAHAPKRCDQKRRKPCSVTAGCSQTF